MRFIYLIILCLSFFLTPAFAQTQSSPLPEPGAAESPRTAVVADEKAGVIRFIIEGKEVMRLDAAGLHVRDEIEYGGNLSDTGSAHFDEKSAGPAHGK